MNIRSIARSALAFVLGLLIQALPAGAQAGPVPIGYLAWDVTVPGSAGQFDIVNQTGPNASGDSTWPVLTPVALTGLALSVSFSDGTTSNFGSSYFSLSADGLSFDGGVIAIGAGRALPTTATLTGLFGVADVMLFDGTTTRLEPAFSTTIALRSGGLVDGDLQIVYASGTAVAAVPEPATYGLILIGLAALALAGARRGRAASSRTKSTFAAFALMTSASLVAAPASAAVKLNTWTAPDNGVAGSTYVNLTASGIALAVGDSLSGASVTLATTCGGAAVGTATSNSIRPVLATSYRIQFALPADLPTGIYAVSMTARSGSGGTYASSNCSQVSVVGASGSAWKTLIGRSWSMPSGSEGWRCTTVQVPVNTYITGFHDMSSPGNDHKIITLSDTATTLGDYNCSPNEIGSKAIYMAGIGTDDLATPPGVAMHIKAGQFVMMNLHLYNPGSQAIVGTSAVQVQTVGSTMVSEEAELMLIGTFAISIPPDGLAHTANGGCAAPADYRVFALMPRMGAASTHVHLIQRRISPDVLLDVLDAPYDFRSQRVVPLAAPLPVARGDFFGLTCTYVNTGAQQLTFGDGAFSEQCFVGAYRSPVVPTSTVEGSRAGTLFECVSN